MNLIIFDIDGTIVDSVKTDDECFIEAFQHLHNIDLLGADWNDFKHVTDSGLTSEIFEKQLNRQPSKNEILELKTYFYNLLCQRKNEIAEIEGAISTLTFLQDDPGFSIAFATGGWKETATFKLSTIGFDIGELIMVSANEHIDRSAITRLAIDKSLIREHRSDFDTITYIGDGLWDFKTTQALGINFIGIDYHKNNKLVEAGATKVLADLTNKMKIIEWAKQKRASIYTDIYSKDGNSKMVKRPKLTKETSVRDFQDFYWYKEELIDFCRSQGLDKRGGKIQLANRIEKYLKTGKKETYQQQKPKNVSRFDWNTEQLTLDTIITDNYKNTENVRSFFKKHLGNAFKFNVKFMNWMKSAEGKALGDALEKWKEISSSMRNNNSAKQIAPQFEYNTYIRDFIKDNPTLSRTVAIDCWKIKKTIRGDNKYSKSDLELVKNIKGLQPDSGEDNVST